MVVGTSTFLPWWAAGLAVKSQGRDWKLTVAEMTPRLFRLAARLLGSSADAEDVVQESFVRAYDVLLTGRLGDDIDAWLYRVVANASYDLLRARRVRSDARGAVSESWRPLDGQAQGDARVALAELEQALAALTADQRVVVVLKDIEGRTSVEIAALLGVSEGAVEQRLVRGRETLRRRLDDHG